MPSIGKHRGFCDMGFGGPIELCNSDAACSSPCAFPGVLCCRNSCTSCHDIGISRSHFEAFRPEKEALPVQVFSKSSSAEPQQLHRANNRVSE